MSNKLSSKELWPNFFIVGTAKAGTTSLYSYLNATPSVFMAKVRGSNYFCSNSFPYNSRLPVIRDKDTYLDLFRGVNDEKAIGEVCTQYLYSSEAPKRIKQTISNARIIINLRNPIERAFSHYLMNTSAGIQKLPFYEALREDYYSKDKSFGIVYLYVELGLYSNQVKRYFDTFGRENVKVLIFEEFIKDTRKYVKEVLNFLEVDAEPASNVERAYMTFFVPKNRIASFLVKSTTIQKLSGYVPETTIKNSIRNKIIKKSVDKPKMSEEAKLFLEDIFREDVANLRSLLDRPLPWSIAS